MRLDFGTKLLLTGEFSLAYLIFVRADCVAGR
jgi:hypothetical protein